MRVPCGNLNYSQAVHIQKILKYPMSMKVRSKITLRGYQYTTMWRENYFEQLMCWTIYRYNGHELMVEKLVEAVDRVESSLLAATTNPSNPVHTLILETSQSMYTVAACLISLVSQKNSHKIKVKTQSDKLLSC